MEVFIFGWWWTSHQSLAHKGSRIVRFCIMLWKGEREPTIKLCHGKTDGRGSKVHWNTELWTKLMVRQWNSSGISSQDSPHCSLSVKSKLSVQPENFTGRIIFMSMFNDISWRSKDNKKECESSAQLVSLYAKRFSPGQWPFLRTWIRKEKLQSEWW